MKTGQHGSPGVSRIRQVREPGCRLHLSGHAVTLGLREWRQEPTGPVLDLNLIYCMIQSGLGSKILSVKKEEGKTGNLITSSSNAAQCRKWK